MTNTAPRFAETFCSQCGKALGPGDNGVSHCEHHGKPRKEPRIITRHCYPPIPVRRLDWCAFRDGDEENGSRYGWGRTETEAVADLLGLEEDGDDMDASGRQTWGDLS